MTPPLSPAPLSDNSGPDRWKVLVVDDEPNVRLLLQKMMERAGHEVRAVGSGTEALGELQRSAYDLLLTDKNIPGGPAGTDVAKAARAFHPDICIVMVTGYASKESANQLLGVVDDYVVKPFQMRPLLDRLKDVMTRRRGLAATRKIIAEISPGLRQVETRRRRVLLIEPEPGERARLMRILDGLGFSVSVGTGPADVAGPPEPDALIIHTGACSPELDRAVWRRQGKRGGFPVVILSDGESLDASIHAVALGASGRLVRPAEESEVAMVLTRALSTSGA